MAADAFAPFIRIPHLPPANDTSSILSVVLFRQSQVPDPNMRIPSLSLFYASVCQVAINPILYLIHQNGVMLHFFERLLDEGLAPTANKTLTNNGHETNNVKC